MIFQSLRDPVPLRDLTIAECILDGLSRHPGGPAIVDGPTGRELTAEELSDRIRRCAGGLAARGIGPGRTVALMAANGPEYPVVFHGTALAGGTVTTANPTYSATELNYQLKDSGAVLLAVDPAFLDTARQAADGTAIEEIIVLGSVDGATSIDDLLGDPMHEQVSVDIENHAAVLPYSSGTTGLPKGVILTHRNIVTNVDQFHACVDLDPGEMTVAFLPFFHIYGQTALMNGYLAAGAGLVTLPRFDPELFLSLVQKHGSRYIFGVPPVAIFLAKHAMVDEYDLSSAKYFITGAAPADGSLLEAVSKRIGVDAKQAYGMTELSPLSHFAPIIGAKPAASGIAGPNTECRIVDPETGTDLGIDEEGELWIRGPQVMKGYLNNEKATAETLVEDGWLRTGDLAIIDADGHMHIRDRLKELIKFKGFQVAPAEVEAALLKCDGLADAAVVGVPDEEAGEVPVAFVVRQPNSDIGEDDIRATVEASLTGYKIPRRFTFVDAIPKTASGKILRRELRKM